MCMQTYVFVCLYMCLRVHMHLCLSVYIWLVFVLPVTGSKLISTHHKADLGVPVSTIPTTVSTPQCY